MERARKAPKTLLRSRARRARPPLKTEFGIFREVVPHPVLSLSLSLSHRSSSTTCGHVPYPRSSLVSAVAACIQYPSLFFSLDLFVSLRMCFCVYNMAYFCVWPVVSHGALSSRV